MTEIRIPIDTPTALCGYCGHRHTVAGIRICYWLDYYDREGTPA